MKNKFITLTNYSNRRKEIINTAAIVEIYETGRSTMITAPNTFLEVKEDINTIADMLAAVDAIAVKKEREQPQDDEK